MSFNDEQRVAVNYKEKSNSIVNAGAGAGKTTSMVGRITKLIKSGVNPNAIFVSTFTKASAVDMTKRLAKSIGKGEAKRVMIGTTHSLFYTLLKNCKMYAGDRKKFTILMDHKKYKFFLDLLKEKELHCKSPLTYMTHISNLKNKNIDALEYAKLVNNNPLYAKMTPNDCSELAISYGYLAYDNFTKKNNYVDFDDMLFLAYRELSDPKNKKYLEILRKTIKYIMIDEAQDLNGIQYELVELISGNNQNIMLILDDFQAIYGWRGSNISRLFDFIEKNKPKIINITTNYRCPPSVVEASNRLIKHNTKQINKTLIPAKKSKSVPDILISEDPENEADTIIDKIQELMVEGYDFSDFCILYRTNAQARALVDRFEMHQIPYDVRSDFSFYDRSDVQDIVAYLRIIVDPANATGKDFNRILNKPLRYLPGNLIYAVEDLEDDKNYPDFWTAFKKYDDSNARVSWKQKQEIQKLIKGICDLQIDFTHRSWQTPELIMNIIRVFEYEKVFNDAKPLEGDEDGKLNLEAIISGAKNFPDPIQFLKFVDKQRAKKKKKTDGDHINLMTIHGSKGMEFPVVIVIGMCDKIMPYYKSVSLEEREEERRLCYVAVTRAEERLILSVINGKFGRMKVYPSPFIAEMGLKMQFMSGGHSMDPASAKALLEAASKAVTA